MRAGSEGGQLVLFPTSSAGERMMPFVKEHLLCILTGLRLEVAVKHAEVKRTPSHPKELHARGEMLMQMGNIHTKLGTQLTLIPFINGQE